MSEPFLSQAEAKISSRSMQIMLAGNGVGDRVDLQQAIMQRFGWDFHYPSALSLPYSQYLNIVEFLREQLYPTHDPNQAYETLAYRAIEYHLDSFSGEIFRVLAGIMGPQQGARRFVQYMAQTLPWGRHQLVEIRPGYACYRKSGVGGPPALMLGVIKACIEATGIKATRLRYNVIASDNHHEVVDYEVEWA